MKVYVSEYDKNKAIWELSNDVYTALMDAKIARIEEIQYMPPQWQGSLDKEIDLMHKASKVSELEPFLDIAYVPKKLTFFTFNNLRCQQDGVPSEVKRFDTLQEALQEYNSLPKEYTTALGGYLGDTNCIDFIHRRNGESVLVNDFKNLEEWANNGLVKQAIKEIVGQLGVEYESDISSLGYQCPVLVPLSDQENINSYFKDKYLRPRSIDEKNLLSAINEVFVEGEGWVPAEKFFNDLKNITPSKETYRPKVTKFNINYVEQNGRYGQADISPADFALLKKQTEERVIKKECIDSQISSAANKTVSSPRKDIPDEPVR